MRIIKLLFLSLLISCGPAPKNGNASKYDSVLNYKGGVVISSGRDMNDCWHLKIRMYNSKTKKYEIRAITVFDGEQFNVGETIR